MADTKLKARLSSTGIPAAALGGAAPAPRMTGLSARMQNVVLGEEVDLPLIGKVWMQVVGHAESNQIEAATFAEMAKVGIAASPLNAWSYDCQRKARTLAVAVRSIDNHAERLGTLEQWLGMDPDVPITDDMLWAWGKIYDDVRARVDPLGDVQISQEVADSIAAAFEKKNPTQLMYFGVASLATWLTSGAVQLTKSATPPSQSGDSSLDTPSE